MKPGLEDMQTPEFMCVMGMNYAFRRMLTARDYGGGNGLESRYAWQSFRLNVKL